MLSKKAEQFARKKHQGQMREFSNEPYFNHVKRVSENIKKYKKSHKSEELVAAAFLHDTLEDTDTTYEEIENKFGKLIASLVEEMSNNKKEISCLSKKRYLASKLSDTEKMSSWGLCLKLSDRLDNISDLNKTSSEFKKKYIEETEYILKTLEKKRQLTETQKRLIRDIKKIILDLK